MNEKEFKVNKAVKFEEEGKFLHALQVYKQLIEDEEYGKFSVIKLANIYEKLNNVETSIKLIENFISKNQEDDNVLNYLANLLLRNNKFEKALEVLNRVKDDDTYESSFLKGYAKFHLGDYEHAIQHFNELIISNTNLELHSDTFLYLAKSYLNLGNLDKAHEAAEKAEMFYQNNSELLLTLAIIFYNKEMFLHAHEKVRKALALSDRNIRVIKWTAKILYKLEEYDRAEKFGKEYLEKFPNDSEINLLMGNVLSSLKREDEAKFYYINSETLGGSQKTVNVD